jgi:hypothetical protein
MSNTIGISNKPSVVFIIALLAIFIPFSKGFLSILEFQVAINSIIALRIAVLVIGTERAVTELVRTRFKGSFYEKFQLYVGAVVFASLFVQFSVLLVDGFETIAAVFLFVSVASVIILSLMSVVDSKNGLPSIVTYASEHEESD